MSSRTGVIWGGAAAAAAGCKGKPEFMVDLLARLCRGVKEKLPSTVADYLPHHPPIFIWLQHQHAALAQAQAFGASAGGHSQDEVMHGAK